MREPKESFPLGLFFVIAFLLALPATRHAGSNVVSRFATTVRLVQDGALSLGDYAAKTSDVALHEGREYSDKAPGVSLALVPVYALVRFFTSDFDRARHVCRLLSLLPLALFAAILFWRELPHWGVSGLHRRVCVAALTVGNIGWAYDAMLYGHGYAAALILPGVLFLTAYQRGRKPVKAALAGLCFGLSIVFEYPTALVALVAGLYLLSFERRWKRLALFVLPGVLLPAVIIGAYNAAAFADPLHLGYSVVRSHHYQAAMSRGLMGIGAPRLSGIYLLLIAPAKGLFFWSPVLLFGLAGIFRMSVGKIREGLFLAGLFCAYLLAFSGHFEPGGGGGLGPRHLVPVIGPLVLAGAWWTARLGPWGRGAFAGVAVVSSLLAAMGVFTEAQMPDRVVNTLWEFSFPLLIEGVGSGNLLGLSDRGAILLAALALGIMWFLVLRPQQGAEKVHRGKTFRSGAILAVLFCAGIYLGAGPYLGSTEPGLLHQVKGNHFAMRGDDERAVFEYRRALETRRDPWILFYLSEALARVGRSREAREAMAEFHSRLGRE